MMRDHKECHKESGNKTLSGCKKWQLQFSDLIIQFQKCYRDLVCFHFFNAFPHHPPLIHLSLSTIEN